MVTWLAVPVKFCATLGQLYWQRVVSSLAIRSNLPVRQTRLVLSLNLVAFVLVQVRVAHVRLHLAVS